MRSGRAHTVPSRATRRYLARHDQEIQVIRDSLRPGRPVPTRLDMLEAVRAREVTDYADGTLGTCRPRRRAAALGR